MVTVVFYFLFCLFFKPVVTSVQTAIPVYLKLKRTISSKQLFGHFDPCGLNSHSSWIKWKNPTLLQWIILGSFCPTPFRSRQETNSPANGISSCVFPSPTDKAVVVEGKLCKNKLKKPTKLNQQPFQLCCASFRQTLAPVPSTSENLRSSVLCQGQWGESRKLGLSYKDIQKGYSGFPRRKFQHKQLHKFRALAFNSGHHQQTQHWVLLLPQFLWTIYIAFSSVLGLR